MNDPCGLVYYKGEYHLFYQYNPYSDVWGDPHWGHAVSKDLIHWKDLPIALEPDNLGSIFTGSVVVDLNDTSGFFAGSSGLVAIYTSALKQGKDDYLQRQSIAYSKNRGRTWNKYSHNPVIDNPAGKDFRDPNVFWHGRTNKWVMVVTQESKVVFYGSENLKKWHFLSSFGEDYGSHEGAWECPVLVKLPCGSGTVRWVLIVGDLNGGPAKGSRTQYFVGDFDGDNFVIDGDLTRPLWMDYGQDFYALQTWKNLPGGRVTGIAWLSNLVYSEKVLSQGWRGVLSVPIVLSLGETPQGQKIIQRPVEEMKCLRRESLEWNCLTVDSTSAFSLDLSSDAVEIVARVELVSASEFGFKVRKEGPEETLIGYNVDTEQLFVDRSRSGSKDFSDSYLDIHRARLEPVNGKIKIRVLVDRSTVEVFGNGGRKTISSLIFPGANGDEILLYARDGQVKLNSLKIYPLNSIW